MRGAMALMLGVLAALGAGCDEEGMRSYGLENRRMHPLKVTARRAKGCADDVDLSRKASFGGAVTQTLEPGALVELSSFWYLSQGPDEDGVALPDAGVSPYYPYTECGAVWLEFPELDYAAVLTWEDRPGYWYDHDNTWRYAVVVEGTRSQVSVHAPDGVEELDVPRR